MLGIAGQEQLSYMATQDERPADGVLVGLDDGRAAGVGGRGSGGGGGNTVASLIYVIY
jgi:hypothetical protein